MSNKILVMFVDIWDYIEWIERLNLGRSQYIYVFPEVESFIGYNDRQLFCGDIPSFHRIAKPELKEYLNEHNIVYNPTLQVLITGETYGSPQQ